MDELHPTPALRLTMQSIRTLVADALRKRMPASDVVPHVRALIDGSKSTLGGNAYALDQHHEILDTMSELVGLADHAAEMAAISPPPDPKAFVAGFGEDVSGYDDVALDKADQDSH